VRRLVLASALVAIANPSGAVAVRWERLGDEAAWRRTCRIGEEARAAVGCTGEAPAQHRLPLPAVPNGATLELAAALAPTTDTPVTVTARIETGEPDASSLTLWTRAIDPATEADRGWQTVVVELPSADAGTRTLVLDASGMDGHAVPATVWARPVLRRLAASPAPLPGVIVVSLDGLRADRLATREDGRPLMPIVDRIARGGFVFERVWASAPAPAASLISMLTGLHACAHRVRRPEAAARRAPRTIADALAAAGWATAAIGDDATSQRSPASTVSGRWHPTGSRTACAGRNRGSRLWLLEFGPGLRALGLEPGDCVAAVLPNSPR
jgi:hypothetical protein